MKFSGYLLIYSSSKNQLIRFWERSGQRSRSRLRKGQKRIFVITLSVFVRFIWNQRQNVHFSIPYPLIWWQMCCWRRYALYRVVCMYVCYQLFSKTSWTELREIFRDDLSSSKDQLIKFWERSGQRSRSRSQKGQKRIFVITHSVFVRFIWNQRQNVHFWIPILWYGDKCGVGEGMPL